MRKLFCLFGIIIVFSDSVLWSMSSPSIPQSLSFGEFMTVFILGLVMIMPEVLSQARRFMRSGRSGPNDVPF
jgi:hypothetical protein